MANETCCNTPPVGKPEPTADNDFDQADGLNIYVQGNRSAKRGVVLVYDIFGLYPQTKKGAAMIASELDCLVIVPDFFDGKGANINWAPMDTEEKRNGMMGFLTAKANPEANLEKLLAITRSTRSLYPSVQSWAAIGLCWGGKLVALASGKQSPFAVSGQAHPAMLDVADASAMTIPHICLASPDEPADIVEAYHQTLDKRSEVETYQTMFHGWMGARANLDNEDNAKEFNRGYKQLSVFFNRYLVATLE